ncbi:MAG: LacI family DNA-binding transcriptional regulator [Planctomycetes bacterium]|nr:LacI family DNA-binding transcriptional regulator [Planctomycetota bacterium]
MHHPGIIDIARKAGVGKSTAARALSGTGAVSARTREKVMKAAEACKYRANTAARTLRRGHSRLLGVVLPESATPGFLSHAVSAQKLEGIARGAKRLGYDLQVFLENLGDVEALHRLAIDKDVRGFFFLGHVEPTVLDLLKRYRIPWIAINWRYADRLADPHCWTDFAHAGRTLTEHLISVGCRRVIVTDWLSAQYGPFGEHARAAWSAAGLPAADLILHRGREFQHGPAVADAYARALDSADRPDGIIATFEGAAKQAYTLLQERGLRPGVDVAVATFDDLDTAANLAPACTAYRQPLFDMAESAVGEMDRLLTSPRRALTIARDLPGTLWVRDSTTLFNFNFNFNRRPQP